MNKDESVITTEELQAQYRRFSASDLWRKLASQASRAGRGVVRQALQLYYAAQRPETPAWARRTAYGALAYFIIPTDLIPDFIFVAGYTDDLSALALAVTTLASYIDADVRTSADQRMREWFPAEAEVDIDPDAENRRP